MRIFYFITKSEIGGAQTHVYHLVKYMKERGNEVAVMSYPGGWLEEQTKKAGASFYPNYFISNTSNPFKIIGAFRAFRRAISEFKPDLIHCHSSAAGLVGRFAIRGATTTLFTAHSWAFTEGAPLWRKTIGIIGEKFAARYAMKIICVSDYDRQLALRYWIAPPDKLIVIHNGIELSLNNAEQHLERRGSDKIKIIFIGRLAYPKQPLLLLEAFAALIPEIRNRAELLIVGDGPLRRSLEKRITELKIQDRVKILGSVERQRVFSLLGGSDIFVLISKHEGLPISILEAMSAGLPIVASAVGGVPEEVTNECGILVPRLDRQSIMLALGTLIADPILRARLGASARKRVEDKFSLRQMLQKTEEVYLKAVRR